MANAQDALIRDGKSGSDAVSYVLSILFGIASGWLDIRFNELALTSMVVFCGCMLLGFLSPRRPWRWILLICLLVPAVEWFAHSYLPLKPYPAQIAQSLIAFVPGIVGGVGGAVGRGVVDNLFAKK